MKQFRFSLRLLLLLVSFASVILGYAQWRRQAILKVCTELKVDGYAFDVPDEWHDRLWQRKPFVGTVNYSGGEETVVYCLLRTSSKDFLAALTSPTEIERLKRLGVVNYARE